jgi:hypothetical protein
MHQIKKSEYYFPSFDKRTELIREMFNEFIKTDEFKKIRDNFAKKIAAFIKSNEEIFNKNFSKYYTVLSETFLDSMHIRLHTLTEENISFVDNVIAIIDRTDVNDLEKMELLKVIKLSETSM